ncbi:hypothetical protein ACJIZ3_004160 [Penstemon smallii]|uniref:DUF7722 domain-containing protein n=1 Tax=Penstemon smallii TaxID=265156 RepID=A0ABD3S1C8_9LAMI
MSTGQAFPNSSACATVCGGATPPNGHHKVNSKPCTFQMPLHYPRYKKIDYEKMPEGQLDRLLNEYGLPVAGDVDQKRRFAMGAFLWPDQY